MPVDFKEYARRMDKALVHLDEEFGAVRAGRANAKVLDRITVEYYGSETPLNGVATISSPDARTLVISPWDTKLLKDIQKAIQDRLAYGVLGVEMSSLDKIKGIDHYVKLIGHYVMSKLTADVSIRARGSRRPHEVLAATAKHRNTSERSA